MLIRVDHPVAGPMKIPGNPVKLSQTPAVIEEASPILGEHTGQVLKDVLKWDWRRLQDLEEQEV